MRSKIPPCPGIIWLLSFTPKLRLSMLSPRSPSGQSTEITAPITSPFCTVTIGATRCHTSRQRGRA